MSDGIQVFDGDGAMGEVTIRAKYFAITHDEDRDDDTVFMRLALFLSQAESDRTALTLTECQEADRAIRLMRIMGRLRDGPEKMTGMVFQDVHVEWVKGGDRGELEIAINHRPVRPKRRDDGTNI